MTRCEFIFLDSKRAVAEDDLGSVIVIPVYLETRSLFSRYTCLALSFPRGKVIQKRNCMLLNFDLALLVSRRSN